MQTIYKGSSPTIALNVEADLTDWTCLLTIESGVGNAFVKAADEIEWDGEKSRISFWLSQTETLQLSKGTHRIQLRAVNGDEAVASNLVDVQIVDPVLKKVVKSDDN